MKLEKLKNLLEEGPLFKEDFLELGLTEDDLRQIIDVVNDAITYKLTKNEGETNGND